MEIYRNSDFFTYEEVNKFVDCKNIDFFLQNLTQYIQVNGYIKVINFSDEKPNTIINEIGSEYDLRSFEYGLIEHHEKSVDLNIMTVYLNGLVSIADLKISNQNTIKALFPSKYCKYEGKYMDNINGKMDFLLILSLEQFSETVVRNFIINKSENNNHTINMNAERLYNEDLIGDLMEQKLNSGIINFLFDKNEILNTAERDGINIDFDYLKPNKNHITNVSEISSTKEHTYKTAIYL